MLRRVGKGVFRTKGDDSGNLRRSVDVESARSRGRGRRRKSQCHGRVLEVVDPVPIDTGAVRIVDRANGR